MSQAIEASSVIASNKIIRYNNKMEAFKTAQSLEPAATREKLTGFVLLVGAGPDVISAFPAVAVGVEGREKGARGAG